MHFPEFLTHLHFSQLLAQYGYLALFIGCLLEGETLLILAGVAAHQGYLSFPLVLLLALCGGALGDQFFFFLGRRYGSSLIERLPKIARHRDKVHDLLLRHHRWIIVGIRFMYGLRIAGPVIIGSSTIRTGVFMRYNLLGAGIWALGFASTGYLLGKTGRWLLCDFKRLEIIALVLVAAAVLGWWSYLRLRRKQVQA
jgi:membrane protein DedA with SNARE-associated domain